MSKDEPQGCLFAIFNLLKGAKSNGTAPSETLPYRRKKYLLSKAEGAFFDVLQTAVGQQYLIFAKVRLADLVYIEKGTKSRQTYQNKIQSKHIDFVLCDPKSISPILAIELDDSSHNRSDRQDRDALVDEALNAAGLPLLRVKTRSGYNPEDLVQAIQTAIQDRGIIS